MAPKRTARRKVTTPKMDLQTVEIQTQPVSQEVKQDSNPSVLAMFESLQKRLEQAEKRNEEINQEL